MRTHVGEDEVLLDDARRYAERAAAAGAEVAVDVWEGMAHGFVSGVGVFSAADVALNAMCAFLKGKVEPSGGA